MSLLSGRRCAPHLVWVVLAVVLTACGMPDSTDGAARARFDQVSGSAPQLRAFLFRMPKGADLHTHLSGAAYAEGIIRSGAAAGACFDPATRRALRGPCRPPAQPLATAVRNGARNAELVDAWSMRDFVPTPGRSGHDQFFDSFGTFGEAGNAVDMATEVVDRAGAQRMRHIELMITFQSGPVRGLADAVHARTPWTGDMAAFESALLAAGLREKVAQGVRDSAGLTAATRDRLGCATATPRPGCGVNIRWIQQVSRTNPPWQVFAQTLFAAMLAEASPDVAGLNFVSPEDNPVALADYTMHMRMIQHVVRARPATRVALHAGELTLGLVPPEDLRFHIRQAVEIAGARRIGHGVAVMYEDDPWGLLHEMARRRVAVEINLTSNAQILGVTAAGHPFAIYRAAGVPMVLSTDDEGVARIDRTHELLLAVTTHRVSWADLVGMERNTLEYAFLDGDSLWADPVAWRRAPDCAGADVRAEPAGACAALLARSVKARLQWGLERDLVAFDAEAAVMRP